jgi:uncharacterized cupin superfamily protein
MNAARAILTLLSLQYLALAAEAPVEVWSAQEIGRISGDLAQPAEAKDIAGKALGAFGNHSTAVWRRARSGQAELHKAKTDLLVITSGEATLITGGAIANARSTSLVEIRGKSIEGGVSRKIGTGDVVRVAAGTPHQFILAKGQSISYFAIKIAK